MCMGVYIGEKVSADGRRIIARSEDQPECVWPKLFLVEPSATEPGRVMKDIGKDRKELVFPLPEHTFKYTRVSDAHPEMGGAYGAHCINEYGFAITATWSLMDITEEFLNLDPLKEKGEGIREASIPDLIACQAKNCREALTLLCDYMERLGSEESGALILSDREEAWFFEIYGGHSYAGMRFADDEMAVLGTQVMMGWADIDGQSGDSVFSPNLKGILDRLPNVVRDKAGRYFIAKSITVARRDSFLGLRVWWAHQLFNPMNTEEFSEEDIYPLCFKPDRQISLEEVFSLLGDRFDGSQYTMMLPKNKERFPPGDDYQSDVHVMELIPELPDDCCYIQWLCMGNARYNAFVPSFSGITDTERHYQYDSIEEETEDYSWYDLGKRMWALAKSDQKEIGLNVRRYQLDEAKRMTEEILGRLPEAVDAYQKGREAGDAFVTDLSRKIAEEQYQLQRKLYRKMVYDNIRSLMDYADMESLEIYRDL